MSDYQTIPCNLCGSTDFKVVFAKMNDRKVALEEKYRSSSHEVCTDQVVRCTGCQLVYINPRPSPDLICKGYTEAVDETYVAQAEGRIRAFRRIARRLARQTPPKGRLLDVGAAAGFLMLAAQEEGFTVEGIELSRWMAEYARQEHGLTIHTEALTAGMFAKASFDVVTMFDVLEHVEDPSASVLCVREILTDHGLFVLTYPDFGSLFAKVLGRRWWFFLSVHLFYFTQATIRRLLEKHGFEVILMKKYYPTLQLGYLCQRLQVYSGMLGRSLGNIFRLLRIGDWNIPYYASQTIVYARVKSP